VLILLLFLTFLQFGAFPNRIIAVITSPINIRPMDIGLLILLAVTFHHKYQKIRYAPLAFQHTLIAIYVLLVGFYTIMGIFQHGYAGVAEFRSVFFYVIILIFVSVNIREHEILPLIRRISTYLMPLILLVPLNLFLTGNFEISTANRQFNAFIYETVTVGFLSGYLYYQYVDRSYKLPLRLLPVFILMIPYCSHRTVWAIIFATFPIILYWTRQNRYIIYAVVLGLLAALYLQMDPTFLNDRLTAFTNLEEDTTGRWRLYIWQAVISQASLLGKGLGARWHVYADVIGDEAMYGAHNGYIQVLYYLGYLGVFSIILLIGYFLYGFFKKTLYTKSTKDALFINRLAFLAAIALSLYMFGYGPDVLSWVYIGFAFKWQYLQKKKGKNFGTRAAQNLHRHSVIQ
jgi:hypothetical protein